MDTSAPNGQAFLTRVLNSAAHGLTKIPLWTMSFGPIPISTILRVNDYQVAALDKLPSQQTLTDLESLCSEQYGGCLFVQAVSLPGEGITMNAEGTQQGALLRGFVNQGREDIGKMKVSFLETNTSFTENMLRPWAIITSHLGMVARGDNLKYRTDIFIKRWALGTGDKSSPIVHQSWHLHDACPINISSEELEASPQTGPVRRQVDFIYRKYSYTAGT